MQYTKNSEVLFDHEIRGMYPNVIFAPATYAEFGYLAYTPESSPVTSTPEEVKAALAFAVSSRLNTKAHEYRYDSIHTAINAVGSHIPKFAGEGAAFLRWWGDTWSYVDQVEVDVAAGFRSIPTEAQLLAELPVFTPP